MVLVTGEPGIGKTALVTRFVRDIGDRARVLWGTCDDLSTPRPFGPFYDLGSAASSELREVVTDEKRRPVLHELLVEELGTPPQPTILVIDDVHWADQATLDAITVVGRRISALPALLILTFREGEVELDHPLRRATAALRGGTCIYLELSPLSRGAVKTLAGEHADLVYAATQGNPFYVTEMISALPHELPASVAGAVLGRAAKLTERSRRLVELVSMVPGRTSVRVLALVMPDWAVAAEEPERRQLLEVGGGYVRFRHELARAAIRSNIPFARRRRLHTLLLDAMLATGSDPADIVHHAERAGDQETLGDYALIAARQAAAVESNREAYAHYRRAAGLSERLPEDQQGRLYEELAWVSYLVGRLDEALEAIDRAVSIQERVGDAEAIGRNTRIRSRLHWYAGHGEKAWRDAERSIRVLEPNGESAELARAYSGLSQLAMLASRDEEAIAWGTKALELAHRVGDERVRAHALINIGVARSNAVPPDRAALREAFEIADRVGDRHEAMRALIALAWTHMHWVPTTAAQYAEKGITYAEQHQIDTLGSYLRATLAWLELRAGRWPRAEELIRRELEMGDTVSQLLSRIVEAELVVRRGDSNAGELLAEVRVLADQTQELQRIGPILELELEWSLTRDEPWPESRFNDVIGAYASHTVWTGKLMGWAAVVGLPVDVEAPKPPPYAAMAARDWRGAADAFGDIGWTYDRALMLSLLEGEGELNEALLIARRLDAAPLEKRVKKRMRALGIAIPRRPRQTTLDNPAGLTSRQLEVLELLAKGLTNAQIAERLFISSRTAEHHVEAILLKLDVSSRVEAAGRYAELVAETATSP